MGRQSNSFPAVLRLAQLIVNLTSTHGSSASLMDDGMVCSYWLPRKNDLYLYHQRLISFFRKDIETFRNIQIHSLSKRYFMDIKNLGNHTPWR